MSASKGRGKVLWFNTSKGYGEILGEDGKKYFACEAGIHSNKKQATLREGAEVEFNIAPLPESFTYEGSVASANRIKSC